jgi:hypothetical protein
MGSTSKGFRFNKIGMANGKVIKVYCQCGYLLFRYFKDIRGRLIKCYLDEIRKGYVGVQSLRNGKTPKCPECKNEIGVVTLIHGRPAIKLNQGNIKKTRT